MGGGEFVNGYWLSLIGPGPELAGSKDSAKARGVTGEILVGTGRGLKIIQ
jgi:hypothetical protein